MENNVHHDVHNADVCTRARREKRRGRGRRKRKRSEWDREVEGGGARRAATRRKKRIEEERRVWLTRERKTTIKGGHADEGKG